ncbi:hypothetical protein CWI75_11335 [Kineobactrum sediminis]|uniref:diacylglycerol O-acyltransferase n=1 Tax=Kineobactrum sediminis TaxID=1905677 RepID=A0A2N5Y1T1_9GAMM|nr:wax ester/triacylglycerol synthase family O-acyltransferase [Kineobactrum sediminis]PLW82350.1 hypothetical protein CWI75_11335 [Kineobactrum sediminis]
MEKLSSQDAGFLKIETPECPFHVAGLVILELPPGAPDSYLNHLADKCRRLNKLFPVFNKKLENPDNLLKAAWITADDYNPDSHVLHYALPEGGRMADLMHLVARAHERHLDRSRPLWELHLIEGLPRNRFALYCKTHHALVDGIGAMQMIQSLFSTDPEQIIDLRKSHRDFSKHRHHPSLVAQLGSYAKGIVTQSRALPQLSRLLAHMATDAIKGNPDAMRLPFTAPRTVFNTELDSRRTLAVCDLPLNTVRRIAHRNGGTINDVLLAICGGALRRYLQAHSTLPGDSLIGGMPVSLKTAPDEPGNRLSYILSPFFTDEANDLRRLQRVIKTTRAAKSEMAKVSTAAAEDFYALLMVPAVLLTLTGNAGRIPAVINAIFSNVPGASSALYLEGAKMETFYPLSIITHGMGLNITVVSHQSKLCFGIVGCPSTQPGIESLSGLIKTSYQALRKTT